MNRKIVAGEVSEYYRQSGWLYKYFWYSQKSLGMHCGFWDKNTKNRDEAIINQFKFIISKAKIHKGMQILDAGCGVGGGAIYISKHTGAISTGITISPEQVVESKRNAVLANVHEITRFYCMDFMKTNFPNNTFDVVFGIESICYSYPKIKFLKEVLRILKPGGIIIINDGYVRREPKNQKENDLRVAMCDGWHMPELVHYKYMSKVIHEAGFSQPEVEDKANQVRPTLLSINKLITLFRPLFSLSKYLKIPKLRSIYDNVQALATLAEGDNIGLFGYYSISARKPVT